MYTLWQIEIYALLERVMERCDGQDLFEKAEFDDLRRRLFVVE
jgi:hypothetical protein